MDSYHHPSIHKYGEVTTDYELFEIGLLDASEHYDRDQDLKGDKNRSKESIDHPALKILGVGVFIMFATVMKLTHESKPNGWVSSRTLAPPEHLDSVCSPYHVKTRRGAAKCEAMCSTARCCHSSCWAENKGSCSKYHHYCSILDRVHHSTGEPHDLLPRNFQSEWFGEERLNQHDDIHTTAAYKNIFAREGNDKLDPCNSLETKQGMRSCIRQCMPGACCFMNESHNFMSTQCKSVSGKMVSCADYQHCSTLFH